MTLAVPSPCQILASLALAFVPVFFPTYIPSQQSAISFNELSFSTGRREFLYVLLIFLMVVDPSHSSFLTSTPRPGVSNRRNAFYISIRPSFRSSSVGDGCAGPYRKTDIQGGES